MKFYILNYFLVADSSSIHPLVEELDEIEITIERTSIKDEDECRCFCYLTSSANQAPTSFRKEGWVPPLFMHRYLSFPIPFILLIFRKLFHEMILK